MAKLGTFKVGDSGVTLTQGRGKNKTVVLDVSFKELEIWAAKNLIDEKKLWTRSYIRAMKGLQGKFRSVIKNAGGVAGVPKFRDFEAFTLELRAVKNKSGPMGGILTDPSLIWYDLDKRNSKCTLGWKKQYAQTAVAFQDGTAPESSTRYFTDPEFRHFWHKDGVKEIPHQYVHNPRRVLPEPFGTFVDAHLKSWAEHNFYKELARQMAERRLA